MAASPVSAGRDGHVPCRTTEPADRRRKQAGSPDIKAAGVPPASHASGNCTEAVGIMKNSVTWRLLIMIAGALLALTAGIGTALPASATETAAAARSGLSLSVYGKGSYSVRGSGYSAKTIHVWVVNTDTDRAVSDRTLKTKGGSFSFSGSGLKCGARYRAVSFSKVDGWDESSTVHLKC